MCMWWLLVCYDWVCVFICIGWQLVGVMCKVLWYLGNKVCISDNVCLWKWLIIVVSVSCCLVVLVVFLMCLCVFRLMLCDFGVCMVGFSSLCLEFINWKVSCGKYSILLVFSVVIQFWLGYLICYLVRLILIICDFMVCIMFVSVLFVWLSWWFWFVCKVGWMWFVM